MFRFLLKYFNHKLAIIFTICVYSITLILILLLLNHDSPEMRYLNI